MIGSSEASKTRWAGPAVAVLVVGLCSVGMQSALGQCPCVDEPSGFGGGDGSEADPYQVCTPEHLDNVRNHLSSYFVQTADIDMTGVAFMPIGDDANRFEGTYDGLGFTIANLTIDLPDTDDVGLFGAIGETGLVQNMDLQDVGVDGRNRVGGLAGRNFGLVEHSHVSGNVVGENRVGGMAGWNQQGVVHSSSTDIIVDFRGEGDMFGGLVGLNHGEISSSSSVGSLQAATQSGGLVGLCESNSSINQSSSTTNVSASSIFIGGLVGILADSSIGNSHAHGSVSGASGVGGLVGGIISLNLSNSHSTGVVTGESETGGLIGGDFGGINVIEASFWDTETSGQSESAGGTGKTTAEMMTQSTFDPPWDFVDVWSIDEGNDYPRLQWESEPPAEPVVECGDFGKLLLSNGIDTSSNGGFAVIAGPMGSCGGGSTVWGDVFNPAPNDVGDPVGEAPSFLQTSFLFADVFEGGANYRTVLSGHPETLDYYDGDFGDCFPPDCPAPNLDVTLLSFIADGDWAGDSVLTVSSEDEVVDLLIALRQEAGVGDDPDTATWTLVYTIISNTTEALPIRMTRYLDGDLYWGTEYDDDVVGAISPDPPVGQWRDVYMSNPAGRETEAITLHGESSDGTVPQYVAAKWGINPTGEPECPDMGAGTDHQEWMAGGIPACGTNFVAGAGFDADGASDDLEPADGHVVMQFETTVPPAGGGSLELTFVSTYGLRPMRDCNGNSISDADDIAGGTSSDCQPDGIPDECDIADGASADCNSNETPDECDIAAGDSVDCNANGMPDECEEFCEGDANCDGAVDPLDSG